MELFRLCREKHSHSLNASGVANRWNKENEFVIYAGSSRSLSTLEMLVHRNSIKILDSYKMLVISVEDKKNTIVSLSLNDLPSNWKKLEAYSDLQFIGSDWYQNKKSLLLKIPSAVIDQEFNFIINTLHSDFRKNVELLYKENYCWDDRLVS